jgi:hypothetical protein
MRPARHRCSDAPGADSAHVRELRQPARSHLHAPCLREPIPRTAARAAGCAIYANRAPLAAAAGRADITVAMTAAPPTTIRVVRFDIRSIPKKPPAPSVRRRVKAQPGRKAGR